MRIFTVASVAAVAFLLIGCPNAPSSDPSGGNPTTSGGEGGKSESSSSSGVGGKGGAGGKETGAGGSNTGGNGSGGAGNGSGGAGNGAGGNGAGGNGSGGNGMLNCPTLLADLNAKQDDATTCNIDMGQDKQCGNLIDGLCCPIAVNDVNSPEVIAYLAALKAYLDAGCVPSCPPIPCPANPTTMCVVNGSGADCVAGP